MSSFLQTYWHCSPPRGRRGQRRQKPPEKSSSGDDDDSPAADSCSDSAPKKKPGRQTLPRHLKRARVVHDLTEEEKHCESCKQDLRLIGEETSERYEYVQRK